MEFQIWEVLGAAKRNPSEAELGKVLLQLTDALVMMAGRSMGVGDDRLIEILMTIEDSDG